MIAYASPTEIAVIVGWAIILFGMISWIARDRDRNDSAAERQARARRINRKSRWRP